MTLLGSEHSILIRSKFKSVLQLRLQQRRTREQLADQGIMPPLKSPAAFHEQRKSLERSKTGDYLKHKIRSRPEKSELVNMRILQEPAAEGPAHDSQTKLKRARLADNLNERIALRPGPLELVEKNIIPVHSTVKEAAMKVNHVKFPRQEDSYAFEEDSSSESLSPDQPHSEESQCSAEEDSYAFEEDSSSESLSPDQPHSEESQCSAEALTENKSSGSSSPTLTNTEHGSQSKDGSTQNQEENMTNSQETPPIPVPAIVKSKMSEKNRHKKPKDIKPKVKKLKYHQYIPPDQKAEKSPPPQMDSAYARLLQQQQLFLQLQILSQQKHQQNSHPHQQQSFSYQTLNQSTLNKASGEQQSSCASSIQTSSSSSSPVKSSYCNPSISPVRPGPLPANLDDLKVSELRQQLRIRGLPVSGTKTALIERLRPFKDSSPATSADVSTAAFPVTPTGSLSSYQSHGAGFYPFCSSGSTPPISPASSDLSVSGSLPDSFSDVTMSSPQFGLQPSPAQLSADEGQSALGPDAEKDKMLVEKQKVIEELTWKLHQEQRQVEELRMQLHKRKRMQDCPAPPQHMMHLQPPAQMQQFYGVSVKQEQVASSCPLAAKQMKGGCMAHCDLHAAPHCRGPPSSASPAGLSAFLSPQCSPEESPLTKPSSSPSSPGQPYLLRDSHTLPQSASRAARNIQVIHGTCTRLSSQIDFYSSLYNTALVIDKKTVIQSLLQQKSTGQTGSCSYPSDQRNLQPLYHQNPSDNNLSARGSTKAKSSGMQQKEALSLSPRHVEPKSPTSSTAFCSSDPPASGSKGPPCYEDAVKQQMSRSQQMDELLDVLIESGEMPANAKEERFPVTKVVPHLTVSPKFHRHYSHMSPSMLAYDHAAAHGDAHLEVLLSPMSRTQGDAALLKMPAEDGRLEAGDGFNSRDMMDTPVSPTAGKISAVAAEGHGLGMTFAESPWETMEWLDLTPPSSATAFHNGLPPSGPSIFNTEFLDVTDISLNSAMDLHLEHW
ncbi:myocardin [Sinocyclocheilus anshuiensis]|uniref:myocardin n=1 Tax=Sinocyclocheilus anshuiensis TaxID=1608454 RepID=UPI0007BAB680|nr:PREDICTED: myocardin [Sinocyclocheilus anshuiensis]